MLEAILVGLVLAFLVEDVFVAVVIIALYYSLF
jgi:hypothetical protein